MLRPLGVLLLVGALLAVNVQADGDHTLTADERAWLDAHGPIRFAPDPDYPPFESVNETGVVQGINIDLLNRISRNLDIEFEVVLYPNWTVILEAMRAGEVDLLGSLAQTEEREAYMDFTAPYMEVGEVFYVRSDSPYTDSGGLAGKRVAVIQDYAAGGWLAENRPDLELVPVSDMVSGLEALSTGQVEAFFENVPVAGYYIRQLSFTNIRILGTPEYYSAANWGVPDGNDILLSIMKKGMASIPPGEETAVFEYWTGYDLGVREREGEHTAVFSPFARNTLLVVLVVLVVSSAWALSLKRTVRAKTRELRDVNRRLRDDVALRRAAEEEVRSVNDRLEARVAERTHDLDAARQRLESFAYTVSHDLKQPLAVLRMQAAIINNKTEGVDTSGLVKQVARMDRFIDGILAFSKAATEVSRHPDIDLSAQARQVLHDLQASSESEVDGQIQPDLVVDADPVLTESLLNNLLGNAWKYTAGRPDATIAFGRRGDGVYFVRDNGPGFDSAMEGDLLFRPFHQLGGAEKGSGIGLATAKRIVEAHGGKIWAESRPGEGATFYFTLGAETGKEPAACAERVAVRPSR
ncbi:MAG: transporter substrate-binding domain-containing protein [Euryarchaeota archaeon]|nr:transporter substrate-binding domain-containing protein [Euryarchaeota archaeon]